MNTHSGVSERRRCGSDVFVLTSLVVAIRGERRHGWRELLLLSVTSPEEHRLT